MALEASGRNIAIKGLTTRTAFSISTGNFRAVEGRSDTLGRLDPELAEQYRADNPRYTVLSYRTPIAWITSSGLIRIPDVTYSQTTKQHLGYVRTYLT